MFLLLSLMHLDWSQNRYPLPHLRRKTCLFAAPVLAYLSRSSKAFYNQLYVSNQKVLFKYLAIRTVICLYCCHLHKMCVFEGCLRRGLLWWTSVCFKIKCDPLWVGLLWVTFLITCWKQLGLPDLLMTSVWSLLFSASCLMPPFKRPWTGVCKTVWNAKRMPVRCSYFCSLRISSPIRVPSKVVLDHPAME